ncbi:MAG TPA: hypothetical protein VGD17_20120 [Chitinophagaceae bacterium]
MASVGASANLYNGTEYTASYPMTNGTPFWDIAEFRNGNISYEGIVYKDIPMIYDLVANEVLIRGIRMQIIKLDNNRIDFFEIGNHRFVRFTGDTTNKNLLPVDIYDLVLNDEVKVYVKRKKQVARNISENGKYDFIEYHSYFVYKDGWFHPVANRKDLLKIFRDKSEPVKTFWKEKRIDFRKNFEQAIIKTVSYYSLLKNTGQ